MDEPLFCEREHRRRGGPLGDQCRRHLDQRAPLDERLQLLAEAFARVPFGVRDDRPEPSCCQLVHHGDRRIAERPGPRLEQDPEAVAIERDLAHDQSSVRRRARLGELAALSHPDRDPSPGKLLVDRRDPLHEPRYRYGVVGTDVRRRAHDLDAVLRGLPGHRNAVLEVDRPVVESVQDVAVEVDHGASVCHL